MYLVFFLQGVAGADPGFWKGGGVWVINWQCAHRRCAPLGSLKVCPLGTFEILDAFSCNLVHILSKNYFVYLHSVDERGGGVLETI